MTPTTEDVRFIWVVSQTGCTARAEFDRWLNEVKAEVREQAAQRIEKMLPLYTTRPTRLALRAAAEAVRWGVTLAGP